MLKTLCRKIGLLLFVSALLVGFSAAAIASAQSQVVPARIVSLDVATLDGTSLKDKPLMAGGTYKFTITLEIAAGVKDRPMLETRLKRYGDRYWSLQGSYAGIDTATWQPGQPTISFNPVQGTARIELQGTVPDDYVIQSLPNGDVLHTTKNLSIVRLSLASGVQLEEKNLQVIDKSIESYQAMLASKTKLLEGAKTDVRYGELVRSVMDKAKTLASVGYADRARDILNTIPDSGWPSPQGSTGMVLLIAIAGLAIVVVALAVWTVRSRSASGFVIRRVDEEARKLDLVSARAKKTGDTTLATDISKVKEELEKLCGR